ncbi:hypothetical protein ACWCV9_05640 [Streptomyces sp. NPDC001606]
MTTAPASAAPAIRAWPAQVRSRTAAAVLLGGPDPGTPLTGRPVVGGIFDPAASLDGDGAFLGVGSLHGGRDITWESGRFRNNLTVSDPDALPAFPERHRTAGG